METVKLVIPQLRRTNKAKTNSRLRAYPFQEWLDSARDTLAPGYDDDTDPDEVLVAFQSTDFPDVSRAQFVQDLHRIARLATDQAPHGTGYIVRTSTAQVGPNQLAFVFYRVPREEARGSADAANARRVRERVGISPEVAARIGQQPSGPGSAPLPPAADPPAVSPDPEWCNGGGRLGYHRWGTPPPGIETCVCTPAPVTEPEPEPEPEPAAAPAAPAPPSSFPPPPPFVSPTAGTP